MTEGDRAGVRLWGQLGNRPGMAAVWEIMRQFSRLKVQKCGHAQGSLTPQSGQPVARWPSG